jgi:HK97 family phage major capsid protein
MGLKALAEGTGSSGGFFVPTELADEVLALVRSESVVLSMGVRRIKVRKELALNRLSTGATAYWIGENAPIPVSEETFAQEVLLRPKELGALVPVSERLLRDSVETPEVEDIIRRDLAEVLALRADLAFLQGTGTGNEPRGVLNQPGLTPGPDLGTNGRPITFDDLMDVLAAARTANASFNKPAWLFNGRLINSLTKLKDSAGRYLYETGLLQYEPTGRTGRLLGFPFFVSRQIPTNLTRGSSTDTTYVLFVADAETIWIGENQEIEIIVSADATYVDTGGNWVSAFQARQHLFRAVTALDLGLTRPEWIVLLDGIRP